MSFFTRCVVPLIPLTPEEPAFDLILYGVRDTDLMTVPNKIVESLARRYPNHTSSIFTIYNLTEKDAAP